MMLFALYAFKFGIPEEMTLKLMWPSTSQIVLKFFLRALRVAILRVLTVLRVFDGFEGCREFFEGLKNAYHGYLCYMVLCVITLGYL